MDADQKKKGVALLSSHNQHSASDQPKAMNIRRSANSRFIVNHEYGGDRPSETHAVSNMKELQDHIEAHLGDRPPAPKPLKGQPAESPQQAPHSDREPGELMAAQPHNSADPASLLRQQ